MTPLSQGRVRELSAFMERIGVPFRNIELLDLALTHSSVTNEQPGRGQGDNQRLEYLGDAVLGFLVAEWLFRRYPESQEGELTRLRSHIVRTESLAELGRGLDIGRYLRMGRGEEASGGRSREANLAAAVEALFGALYLDRGLETLRALIEDHLEHTAADIEQQRLHKNAKSYLQEYTQLHLSVTPTYAIVDEQGPDHARTFTAQVLVAGEIWGQGTGHSKQAAEQAAARRAIDERAI